MYKQMNESMYGWKGKKYILFDILCINISGDIKIHWLQEVLEGAFYCFCFLCEYLAEKS